MALLEKAEAKYEFLLKRKDILRTIATQNSRALDDVGKSIEEFHGNLKVVIKMLGMEKRHYRLFGFIPVHPLTPKVIGGTIAGLLSSIIGKELFKWIFD